MARWKFRRGYIIRDKNGAVIVDQHDPKRMDYPPFYTNDESLVRGREWMWDRVDEEKERPTPDAKAVHNAPKNRAYSAKTER